MGSLIYEEETFLIRGAVFEVYKTMGSGFVEVVYQECLAKEFHRLKLPFVEQVPLTLYYKGEVLLHVFKPDFVCFGKVILELKAVKELTDEHRAQILNYLKASGIKVGLLINFGHYPQAQIERFAL